jgi:proteasome activator subunit 2 (PA28 beta)
LRDYSLQPQVCEGTVTLTELTKATACLLKIRQEVNQLQGAIHESMQVATDIKLWLQCNIPRVEDGNNFGVDIQESVVQELTRAEDAGMGAYEGLGRWWQLRAELIGKVIKFGMRSDCSRSGSDPHSSQGWNCSACTFALDEPSVYALLDSDRRFLGNIWMGWMDLRNNYAVLHDIIYKNLDKLVNPRSENTSNMY